MEITEKEFGKYIKRYYLCIVKIKQIRL